MDPVSASSASVSYWPLLVLLVSMVFVVVGIAVMKIHPFFVLVLAAILVGLLTRDFQDAPEANQLVHAVELAMSELGAMAGGVAFVILLAAIIGMCMLRSGAADAIVRRAIAVLGESRAPVALLLAGFFLAIPAFFDTVFFLLLPLARALAARTGRLYVLYILAICAGGVLAHVLVAPTPGPLIMAEALRPIGVDLGMSIPAGVAAGVLPALVMLYVARWLDWKRPIAVRDGIDGGSGSGDAVAGAGQDEDASLPSFFVATLPIIVPVLLISLSSYVELFIADMPGPLGNPPRDGGAFHGELITGIHFIGNKHIAMLIGAVLATYIFIRQRRLTVAAVMDELGSPIATGGVIVLITAAGGAFGAMIRHSGVGEVIQVIVNAHSIDYIVLAWVVTAIIRVAQGSATVAMITAAGLMTAIIGDASLAVHPLYIFLAIGFGSLFCSWMNDSGFWIVGKLSGFTERETLQTWTVMTIVVSVTGLIQILLLSRLLPLA